jgi:hypothetical protein
MRCGGGEALVLSSGEHLRRHAQLTNCIPMGESSASGFAALMRDLLVMQHSRFLRDLSTAPLHQLLLQQGRWLATEPNTNPPGRGRLKTLLDQIAENPQQPKPGRRPPIRARTRPPRRGHHHRWRSRSLAAFSGELLCIN